MTWIVLTTFIVTVIAIVLGIVFGYTKNTGYRKFIYVSAATCALLIAFCIILAGFYSNEVAELQSEYNDIMLYHGIINDSINEQARFGHYEKIYNFNTEYKNLMLVSENEFFGALFPQHWSENMEPIEFQFRGVNYYAGN